MIALLASMLTLASTPVLLPNPLSVKECSSLESFSRSLRQAYGRGILSHVKEDTHVLDSLMHCAQIQELPGAYFCHAFLQAHMNRSFTRIGFFMGAAAGFDAETLLPSSSQELTNYQKIVAGHNLPGGTLIRFFQKVGSETTPEEKALSKMVKILEERHKTDFYLVASSVQNVKPALSVLSHEIHHAQYYLNPKYRKVVESFWMGKVSSEDRQKIKETLASAYNVSDPILLDEFQAYVLQAGAEKDRLQKFVSPYGDSLRDALKRQGIEVVSPPETCNFF